MSRNKDFPFHLLSEEQKDFILQTVDFGSYFAWDDGLVHKLGVREFSGETNPTAPVVRCESMIIFRSCTFDSFLSVPKLDNIRISDCTFLDMEGYNDGWRDSIYSTNLPSFLWGAGFKNDWASLRFSGHKFVLPSTGTRFISSLELIPEIDQAFHKLYQCAVYETSDLVNEDTAKEVTEGFEMIWLKKLRMDFPDLFFAEVCKLLPHRRKRVLEMAGISEDNFDLLRSFSEKIL